MKKLIVKRFDEQVLKKLSIKDCERAYTVFFHNNKAGIDDPIQFGSFLSLYIHLLYFVTYFIGTVTNQWTGLRYDRI